MKKILVLVALASLLSACSRTPSVQDMVDNPELLEKTLKKCVVQSKEDWGEECDNAQKALEQAASNMLNNMLNN